MKTWSMKWYCIQDKSSYSTSSSCHILKLIFFMISIFYFPCNSFTLHLPLFLIFLFFGKLFSLIKLSIYIQIKVALESGNRKFIKVPFLNNLLFKWWWRGLTVQSCHLFNILFHLQNCSKERTKKVITSNWRTMNKWKSDNIIEVGRLTNNLKSFSK